MVKSLAISNQRHLVSYCNFFTERFQYFVFKNCMVAFDRNDIYWSWKQTQNQCKQCLISRQQKTGKKNINCKNNFIWDIQYIPNYLSFVKAKKRNGNFFRKISVSKERKKTLASHFSFHWLSNDHFFFSFLESNKKTHFTWLLFFTVL